MKNILAIGYSQTGQLFEILDNFLKPLSEHQIERVAIQPASPYPYPWTTDVFFDLMPECVLEEPITLAPFQLERKQYDLVVLAYQPWFLSPSLPTTALFDSPEFRAVLEGTPVVTVIGARNMWLNSQDSVVRWVQDARGYIVANVPFVDKVQNHLSAFTILHWMLTGKKTKKWGFLPFPGVAQSEIDTAGQYVQPIVQALEKGSYRGIQQQILTLGGIAVPASIMFIEMAGKHIFRVWANIIKSKTAEKRPKFVRFFKWYLVIALFIVSPIILVLYYLVILPLTYPRIKRRQERYLYLGIEK